MTHPNSPGQINIAGVCVCGQRRAAAAPGRACGLSPQAIGGEGHFCPRQKCLIIRHLLLQCFIPSHSIQNRGQRHVAFRAIGQPSRWVSLPSSLRVSRDGGAVCTGMSPAGGVPSAPPACLPGRVAAGGASDPGPPWRGRAPRGGELRVRSDAGSSSVQIVTAVAGAVLQMARFPSTRSHLVPWGCAQPAAVSAHSRDVLALTRTPTAP